MNRWQGKVAVVTGASSGIGRDVAKRLVGEGLKVIGLARRINIVEEFAKELSGKPGKLFAFKCDVSKEEEVKQVFGKIKNSVGPVALLVNNAGVATQSSFIDGNPKDWKNLLDINLFGTAICSQAAIKQMKEDDFGHIININSIAGHKIIDVIPNNTNMYTSSKYGVTAFTEVLRQELRNCKSKIKVTSISPGLVDTGIFQASNITEMSPNVVQQLPHLLSEDITDGLIYAISTKPHVQVHEIIIKPLGETF